MLVGSWKNREGNLDKEYSNYKGLVSDLETGRINAIYLYDFFIIFYPLNIILRGKMKLNIIALFYPLNEPENIILIYNLHGLIVLNVL